MINKTALPSAATRQAPATPENGNQTNTDQLEYNEYTKRLGFCGDVFVLTPRPAEISLAQRVHPVVLRWINPDAYDRIYRLSNPVQPMVIGTIQDREAFSRLPIGHIDYFPYYPEKKVYRIPIEWVDLRETLQQMIDCEHAICQRASGWGALLSYQKTVVAPNTVHRVEHFHCDSGRHNFSVTDCLPMKCYLQQFGVNDADYRTASEELAWSPHDHEIVLMDDCIVHRSAVNEQNVDVLRTFMRLSFHGKESYLDRFVNKRYAEGRVDLETYLRLTAGLEI